MKAITTMKIVTAIALVAALNGTAVAAEPIMRTVAGPLVACFNREALAKIERIYRATKEGTFHIAVANGFIENHTCFGLNRGDGPFELDDSDADGFLCSFKFPGVQPGARLWGLCWSLNPPSEGPPVARPATR